jgi:hypothetical protein
MTEEEWMACAEPKPMLEFLRGKTSDRKLRLFACGCCRSVWSAILDNDSRYAVDITERFADGSAYEIELMAVCGSLSDASDQVKGNAQRAMFTAMASMRPVAILAASLVNRVPTVTR